MRHRWQHMGRNTRIMTAAMMIWAMGEGLWLHIQPLYLSSLGASAQQTGFILAISGLARLLVMIPAGLLADRYGARRVMLPGWFLGMIGVIVIAIAPNYYMLTLGFFLYGASALAIPVINLYLIQSIGEDRTVSKQFSAQETLTFVYGLFWLAMIISPALGGLLAEISSLRSVFAASALWFIISTIVVFQTEDYPPSPPFQRSLRYALHQYQDMLRQKQITLMYGIFMLAFMTVILGYTFAPQFLEDKRGLSPSVIGLFSTCIAAGGFCWNLVLGQCGAWQGFLASVGLTAISFIFLITFEAPIMILIAYFAMGAFEALRPLVTGIIAKHTVPTTQGGAFGLIDTLHGVSSFAAPGIAGLLYTWGNTWPFLVAIAIVPLIFGLVSSMTNRENLMPAN